MLDMRGQNRMLLLASYIFYGWWDVRFLYLVVLSTGLDFCCGLILGPGKIPAGDRARVSILLILAALGFVTIRWDVWPPVSPPGQGTTSAVAGLLSVVGLPPDF